MTALQSMVHSAASLTRHTRVPTGLVGPMPGERTVIELEGPLSTKGLRAGMGEKNRGRSQYCVEFSGVNWLC